MVKKKRQSDHQNYNNDSSTESCDEKSANSSSHGTGLPVSGNVGGSSNNSSIECQHVKKAVDVQKLRKLFKKRTLQKDNCIECMRMPSTSTEKPSINETETEHIYWICLKCGSQLCGSTKSMHVLKHYQTPRSDCHAIALNITTSEIWCHSCNNVVNLSLHKSLRECTEFVQKLSLKALTVSAVVQGDDSTEVNNQVDDKILEPLETMRPSISTEPTPTTTPLTPLTPAAGAIVFNGFMGTSAGIASTSSASAPIPGMARRVQQPTATIISPIPDEQIQQPLPRVRGLANLGNTCFFNAVMQCLAQTPYLLDVLTESMNPGEEFTLPGGNFVFKDGQETILPPIKGELSGWGGLTSGLAEALEELQMDGGVFRPNKLFSKLTTKCQQFRGGDQHDSHELLRHLLESVRSEDLQRYQKVILNHLNYKDINSVGDEMRQKCKIYGQQAADRILRPEQVFRGFLVSTLTCQDCFHTSSRHENFLDISLPVSVEKPQPPMRRKTSPDMSPTLSLSSTTPSKHQLKKEKEKDRKARRAAKKLNKRASKTSCIGPAGDNNYLATASVSGAGSSSNLRENSNSNSIQSSSSSSSDEQSDADVEDNLIDDAPKRGNVKKYDPNGNNEMSSPLDPEKRGDSPENPNKYSFDENGIATSPSNINSSRSIKQEMGASALNEDGNNDDDQPTNLLLALGISQKGASLVRQNIDIDSLNTDLEKLDIIQHPEITEAKKVAKQKRMRTQSHSDWSSTIAPRYQCDDGECSIQSCLNNFTAVELMTGNNKVGCDGCTQRINGNDGKTVYTNATKQFLISSPPAVLILHLKRFQVGARFMFRKLARAVSFPMVLDIAPFCGSKVKNLPNIDLKQKRLLYGLYGVVEHSGGMYGGHYTAYVKVRAKLPETDKRWKFMPQGSKAELDQTDEQKAKLDELMAREKARELRMKSDDSDDYTTSCDSSSEPDNVNEDNDGETELEGAFGGSALNNDALPNIEAPPGKWYYVSDSRVQEVPEDTVLRAQAYLLFYERIY